MMSRHGASIALGHDCKILSYNLLNGRECWNNKFIKTKGGTIFQLKTDASCRIRSVTIEIRLSWSSFAIPNSALVPEFTPSSTLGSFLMLASTLANAASDTPTGHIASSLSSRCFFALLHCNSATFDKFCSLELQR